MTFLEQLEQFYKEESPEEMRLQKDSLQYLEFLTASKYINLSINKNSIILDSCAGTGKYSFYLAQRGHSVTAGDIVPFNVSIIREKQDKTPILKEIYQGDALDLHQFKDSSFDVVLCMGALYHLLEEKDRKKAIQESLRVLKKDGIFICTYMNRYAVILGNCDGDLNNIDEILQFAQEGKEGIFYASSPEKIEVMMKQFSLKKLHHIALDGMACFLYQAAGLLTETGFHQWQKYHFAVCEKPSLLGSSYHNMFIGRKTS